MDASTLNKMRKRLIEVVNLPTLMFGHEEAEYDVPLLSDFFVSLPVLFPILNGRRNIIVGPKGSGKSAVYSFLVKKCNHYTADGHNFESFFMDQTFLPLSLHAQGKYHNLFFPRDEKISREYLEGVWLSLIASITCTEILQGSSWKDVPGYREFQQTCRDAGFDIGRISRLVIVGKNIFSSILSSIKVDVDSEGKASFQFEANLREKSKSKRSKNVDPWKVLSAADNLLRSSCRKIAICIDDLDRLYSYTRPSEAMLVQALFTVNDAIKSLYGIRPVIFIRSDIFADAEVLQSDKVAARSVDIGWSLEMILELLYLRLYAVPEIKAIMNEVGDLTRQESQQVLFFLAFPAFTDVGGQYPESHFGGLRLWLGANLCDSNKNILPRTVIHLLNQAALTTRREEQDNTLFNLNGLVKSLRFVSSALLNVFVNDYGTSRQIIELINSRSMSNFTFDEIMSYFPKEEGPLISNQLDVLSKLGFVSKIRVDAAEGIPRGGAYRYFVGAIFKHHWPSQG